MIYYDIVSLVCLGLVIFEAVLLLFNLLFKKRADKIEFLRGFKRGKYAFIFVISAPLYYVGHIYQGEGKLSAIFTSIKDILHIVVLDFDTDKITKLLETSKIYSIAVYACFTLVVINALSLVFSISSQYVWESFNSLKLRLIPRDKLVIYGLNDGNEKLYSASNKRCKVIIDDIDKETTDRLYIEGKAYISVNNISDALGAFVSHSARSLRNYIIVINTGSDDKNILVCRELIRFVESFKEKDKEKLFKKLSVYVFGNPAYEAVYEDMVASGYGCFHYVNKYQNIAIDFIDNYPISRFMDERHIDYKNALVHKDVDINVIFVGFGKVNRQIFLASVANNQFITSSGTDPVLKPVSYHIFDKNATENDKNLNHGYYRFKHEFGDADQKKYLPLPSLPAREVYHRIDVNDYAFYDTILDIVRKDKNSVNYIVISFGTDLENIDLAEKLVKKRFEWGLDNLVIFVKAGAFRKCDTMIEEENCFFIGNDMDAVYNIENIVSDKIHTMAMRRNEAYDLEYAISENKDREVNADFVFEEKVRSEKNWHLKSSLDRDSSLYSVLSLRSKLNLMGLDYVSADAPEAGLSYDEYMAIYAKDDMPNVETFNLQVGGKPTIAYTLNFPKSKRRNLAIQEHQRWNSFMISRGNVPATLDEILTEKGMKNGKLKYTNGKNIKARKHGNLTTFDGLVTFRRMVAERDGKPESGYDVIKYDYQLLDEAYWLLTLTGYKIIKRK